MEKIASSRRCWFPLWKEASVHAVGRRRLDQLHDIVLRVARLGVAHNEAGLFHLECGVIIGGVLEDEPLVDLQSATPSLASFKSMHKDGTRGNAHLAGFRRLVAFGRNQPTL